MRSLAVFLMILLVIFTKESPCHLKEVVFFSLFYSLKGQPHEGELTGRIVDELRIRLISGEQRTFSCPFATGGKSHRNRQRLQRRPMTTRGSFLRDILIVHGCEANAFYWTLPLHTFAANNHSSHRGTTVWHHKLVCKES